MSAAWVLFGMFVAIGALAIAGLWAHRRRAVREAGIPAVVYGSADSSSWHADGTSVAPCDGGAGNSGNSGGGDCGSGGGD